MQPTWTIDIIWWITGVELPVIGALFWLIWRNRRDADDAVIDLRHDSDMAIAHVRDSLAAYKLEVAKSYASISYLKEVENRLTAHLLRIENKLDGASHVQHGETR